MQRKSYLTIPLVCICALQVAAEQTGKDGNSVAVSPERQRMNADELDRAKPQVDHDGARWKSNQLSSAYSKDQLFGRPSLFTVTQNYVHTPFDDCLLDRQLTTGQFGIDQFRFSADVSQVVSSQERPRTACVLAPIGNGSGDILVFEGISAGKPRALHGHRIEPWRIVFSPDGTRLVSCSDDESIRLWDISTGKEIAKFPFYGYGGNGSTTRGEFVAFSPNGKWLATSFEDKISIRDPTDGTAKITWQPVQLHRIEAIRFSNDSKSLFAFLGGPPESKPNTLAFIQFNFELPFDPVIRRFKGDHFAVDGLIVPDEKHLITWNGSPEVCIWDIESRKGVAVLKVAPKSLYDLTLSPRGTFLATAGDDGEIKFWDLAKRTQQPTKQPYRHEGVDCVRFSPDGKYLITASDDGWLKVWDAPEFVFDQALNPERIEVLADGTIRDVYPDGMVKYRRIPKDEE